MMLSAIAAVSTGVIGSRSMRRSPSGSRIIGADPTLTCRSDPWPSMRSFSQPSNSATAESVLSTAPHLVSSGYLEDARRTTPSSSPIGRSEDELQPVSGVRLGSSPHDDTADGTPIRERLERTQVQPGARSLQHAFEQTPVHRAHKLPVLLEEVSERAASQGDLHRPVPSAAEPRIEARFRQRLSKGCQVGPGTTCPRWRGVAGHEVVTPFAREGLRTRPCA